MKKKIFSVLTAAAMAFCALFPVLQEAVRAEAASDKPTVSQARKFDREEHYAIVPLNAGSSTVEASYTGRVQLWKIHRGENQRWRVTETGDYCYFTDTRSGNVITVGGEARANQELVLTAYTGADNQLWKLEDAGDDSYYIHSKLDPRLVMDNLGASTNNGASIAIFDAHFGSNQRFRFVSESTVRPRSEWGASRSDCTGDAWDYWDGAADTAWYYADPSARIYSLDTASQLAGVSQLVRDKVTDFSGRTICLNKDLNLCSVEWRRIGSADSAFKGSFNGGGHAIVGLSITGSDTYDGFFGCIDGGSVCNFAIQGSVTGDTYIGGVCGWLRSGHISDVYSEITLPKATDDYMGGICGMAEFGGYIENCTQNARVNSGDRDPYRGGIAGYSRANIRYCVNRGAVECDWNYVGGIAGFCAGAKIEYCANYGRVAGGDWAERVGGICGESNGDAVIFSCYNEGAVYSSGDDYIGGIVGWQTENSRILGCINLGTVQGDTYVGGIVGEGICACSFNGGHVSGDGKVGAISGYTTLTNWCRALSGTAGSLNGKGGDCEAEWVSVSDVASGRLAYELNCRCAANGVSLNYAYGASNSIAQNVFYQNLGADLYPTFTGGAVLAANGGYQNESYQVTVDYDRSLGSVEGEGSFRSGSVVLSAKPASGCAFDHYEVTQLSGTEPKTTVYQNAQVTLTDDIKSSYAVRAVFTIFDDTPDDLKQSVRLELECTNDADGWNSSVIPVYLTDSAGKQHEWDIACADLNEEGRRAEHTFELGTAYPVAVCAYPDFGGGVTFRDYGLKARIWVNHAGTAMESEEITIRSYPFVTSVHGDDYMHLTFGDFGVSRVGIIEDDGRITWKGNYSKCSEAWAAAQSLGSKTCIQLQSAWLLDSVMTVGKTETFKASYRNVTIDLNGYPIIRTIKKISEQGGCFIVDYNNTLTISDSAPKSKTCSAFIGGSIQGGRNESGGGLIQVEKDGVLKMTGGGAIQNHGTAELDGVLIASCWADGASTHDNDGGAIYTDGTLSLNHCTIRDCKSYDHAGAVMIGGGSAAFNDVMISGCKAKDNEGGAIYITDGGNLKYTNGAIRNCIAAEDDGGAIYQDEGNLSCEGVVFENNTAEDNGGAVYMNGSEDAADFFKCSFLNNHADDDGGALYVNKIGKEKNCLLFECELLKNSSSGDGGAVYIDYDYTTLHSCTLKENTAGTDQNGGAVYLNSSYKLGVQGKMIAQDNTANGQADNIYIESGAQFTNGGLYDDSIIHLTPSKSSSYKAMRISAAQSQYFRIDRGSKTLENKTNIGERFVSSVIGEGRVAAILTGLMVIILGTAIIIAARGHRHKNS